MIEGEDLELFERSLQHATAHHTGAALDTALEELGWQDALSVDAQAAVSLLFESQGAANVTSSALDHVLADALGGNGHAVVLPPVGQWLAPGTLEQTRLDVHGVGAAGLGEHEIALIVARVGESHVAVEVETASLPQRAIEGRRLAGPGRGDRRGRRCAGGRIGRLAGRHRPRAARARHFAQVLAGIGLPSSPRTPRLATTVGWSAWATWASLARQAT